MNEARGALSSTLHTGRYSSGGSRQHMDTSVVISQRRGRSSSSGHAERRLGVGVQTRICVADYGAIADLDRDRNIAKCLQYLSGLDGSMLSSVDCWLGGMSCAFFM